MEMNKKLKKECMEICEKYEIEIDFNDKDWENEFIEKVNWNNISSCRKLSRSFIDKFQDEVDWFWIQRCQTLSEDFIEKFQDKLDWYYIYYYKLDIKEDFIEKYKHKFSKFIWNLKTDEEKENDVKNAGHDILEDESGKYIIAYKAIRMNNKSFHNPDKYKYIIGKEYESKCNCDVKWENSYGLAAWDKENTIKFGKIASECRNFKDFKLIKVKIYINDIGAIIKENNNKIRCFKFEVVEDLGIYKNGNK